MANRGRPRRAEPKTRAIWCGQMSQEERELILEYLTPEERKEWLLGAARLKQDTGQRVTIVSNRQDIARSQAFPT